VQHLLAAGIQWLLFVAVALFFVSLPITNSRLAWRLRRWSGGILLIVLSIAVVAMEIRVHPIVAGAVAILAMIAAFGILELRRYLRNRKPEPSLGYLNLRSSGKRPVDLDEHPEAFEPRDDTPVDEGR